MTKDLFRIITDELKPYVDSSIMLINKYYDRTRYHRIVDKE